jgi:hypothetical protein
MARFTRELLDNDVSGSDAWTRITDLIRDGAKGVEVLSRMIDGEDKWELRAWDGNRKDGSNSAKASPNTDY